MRDPGGIVYTPREWPRVCLIVSRDGNLDGPGDAISGRWLQVITELAQSMELAAQVEERGGW